MDVEEVAIHQEADTAPLAEDLVQEEACEDLHHQVGMGTDGACVPALVQALVQCQDPGPWVEELLHLGTTTTITAKLQYHVASLLHMDLVGRRRLRQCNLLR
jgi:hypothetical protein